MMTIGLDHYLIISAVLFTFAIAGIFNLTACSASLISSSIDKINSLKNEISNVSNLNLFAVDLSNKDEVYKFCDKISTKF